MSSAVLGAAEAALSLDSGLSDLGEDDPKGSFLGRTVSHWSYKLFIAGSVVGAVAAVAAFLFDWYLIGGISVLLALTNGFAAFYVKRFGVLKTLEHYTGTLAQRVQFLAKKTSELKVINEDLEEINQGFKQIPKSWREEIRKGKIMLKEKTRELEVVAKKLALAEKKLQKLGQVTNQLQQETGKLSKAALEFSQENDFFGTRVDKLKEHVQQLDQHNTGLEAKVAALDTENDQTEEIMAAYTEQNKVLHELFRLMKEMYAQAKLRMEALELEVDQLGAVVPQAVESTTKVEDLAAKYHEMVTVLELKLAKMQKYKKGYQRWKSWITSTEYKTYMQWRAEQKGE